MNNPSDLQRSFLQYKKNQELRWLKISFLRKILLSVLFFLLLPFVVMNIFFIKHRKNTEVFVADQDNKQPYITINKIFRDAKRFKFLKIHNKYIPIVPTVVLKDIVKNPLFSIKHLPFLGGLLLKISKYYFFTKYHNVSNLIVFQEYSFYMTYLTRVMERDGGHLYNVQHGIPGETYCYFRFSKCFIWGEYFRQEYIKNGAESTQFIIVGSILHNHIKKTLKQEEEDIDILYVMQGDSQEMRDVVSVLEELSKNQVVRYIQHPRHPVDMNSTLIETSDNIFYAVSKSKIVISHYSTALLDALIVGKNIIAYLHNTSMQNKYVAYLNSDHIISNKKELASIINKKIQDNHKISLDKKYIDMTRNPIEVIVNEVF